jgi:hypothetical protein
LSFWKKKTKRQKKTKMEEFKFVNLQNLYVEKSEEITSKIKNLKLLRQQKDAIEKEMDNIWENLCVFSVEVILEYVRTRMIFSDLSDAHKVYQLLLEKGIPKSNVFVQYTNEHINDDCSNVNVSFDVNYAQDFVDHSYFLWLEEVKEKTPQKNEITVLATNHK